MTRTVGDVTFVLLPSRTPGAVCIRGRIEVNSLMYQVDTEVSEVSPVGAVMDNLKAQLRHLVMKKLIP